MQSPRQELKLVAAEAKRRQVLAERAAGARCRSALPEREMGSSQLCTDLCLRLIFVTIRSVHIDIWKTIHL